MSTGVAPPPGGVRIILVMVKVPHPAAGGGGDVCACAGNITESTTGLDHDSGSDLPATITPLPAAMDFSNLRRDSLDFLSAIVIATPK